MERRDGLLGRFPSPPSSAHRSGAARLPRALRGDAPTLPEPLLSARPAELPRAGARLAPPRFLRARGPAPAARAPCRPGGGDGATAHPQAGANLLPFLETPLRAHALLMARPERHFHIQDCPPITHARGTPGAQVAQNHCASGAAPAPRAPLRRRRNEMLPRVSPEDPRPPPVPPLVPSGPLPPGGLAPPPPPRPPRDGSERKVGVCDDFCARSGGLNPSTRGPGWERFPP